MCYGYIIILKQVKKLTNSVKYLLWSSFGNCVSDVRVAWEAGYFPSNFSKRCEQGNHSNDGNQSNRGKQTIHPGIFGTQKHI
jgi:hypothetical protein